MDRIREDWKKIGTASAIKEAIRIATSSPLALYQRVIHGGQKAIQYQIEQLMEYMGISTSSLKDYWEAIASKRDLYAYMYGALAGTYYGELQTPQFLYVIVRTLKPAVVVETGVAAGVSSALILEALKDNERGLLYSIDFPNYWAQNYLSKAEQSRLGCSAELFPSLESLGKAPGFAIPQSLETRWALRLGKSKDILPNLLTEIGKTDIFLHDSEHTYDNMMFEYTTAWDYLPKGGLLLSHDISWNNSFRDFSRKVKRRSIEIYFTGTGAIIK